MAVSMSWDGRGVGQGVLTVLLTIGMALLFAMALTEVVNWAVPSPVYPETPMDEAACKEAEGTWKGEGSPLFPIPEGAPGGSCETVEVLEYEQKQAAYDFWSPLIQLTAGALALVVAVLVGQLTSVVRLSLALGGTMVLGSYGGLPSFLSVYLSSGVLPSPDSAFAAYGWVRPLLDIVLFVILAVVAQRRTNR